MRHSSLGSAIVLVPSLAFLAPACRLAPSSEPVGGPFGEVAEGARASEASSGEAFAAPISIPRVTDDAWTLTVAVEGDVRINGVACGDLLPDVAGDEIATVDRLGRLRIHRLRSRAEREADGVAFEEVPLPPIPVVGGDAAGAAAGELVQVVVGDLAPTIPGDEIVAVGVAEGGEDDGGPGAVRVYCRSGANGSWVEHRFVAPALVHAVTIGDVIADRAGNEFLVAGFFGETLIGQLDAFSGGVTLSVRKTGLTHEGNAKGACLVESGFVLACDDGGLVWYHVDEAGEWSRTDRLDLGEPLARVAEYPNGEIAVCGNGGTFRLVHRDAARGHTREVTMVRSDNRLRGAVVADLDPGHPGMETATAGYDGEIRVVRLTVAAATGEDEWDRVSSTAALIARDTAKLHHLTTGVFPGLGSSRVPSLVSCGYSGEVLVLSRRP